MSVGWDSTVEGWESTTAGFDTAGTPTAGVKHGAHMGWTLPYGGPTSHLLDLAESSGVTYVRWGIEVPDYFSTPNNTGGAGTLDLSPVANQIAQVHARTTPAGRPMGVVLAVLGVPRSVNSNAGSSDTDPDGSWHWFATTGGGRTIVANFTVDVSDLLDPGLDYIQMGNELNNGSFNHVIGSTNNGPGAVGANAATVAAQMAEQILAVRSANPTLPIMAGSIMNYGDVYNGTDNATGLTPHIWAAAMIAGDARLKNTGGDARPDLWTHHDYTGSTPPLNGWTVNSTGNAVVTSGSGWATPGLLWMRAYLGIAGVSAPGGSQLKMAVTEYGTARTGTGFSESLQSNYVGQYNFAFEIFKNDGWLLGPNCYYTLSGDTKALYRTTAPYDPYQGGTANQAWALADEVPVESPPVQVAAFTMSRASGVIPLAVTFTDVSTNSPTTWAWTFGDGGTSTSQNPSHTFTTAGAFTVRLTATGPGGALSVTHTITTTATTPPPSAGIPLDVLVEIGTPPLPTSATNTLVIGDATRGKLGSSYVLSDKTFWHPITGDVQEISTHRGRNRDLDRTEAGTATVVVRNDRVDRGTAGDYDPFNWSSPYFPFLGPRARMRISVDGVYIFGGDVSDMPVEDIADNVVTTTFNLVDSFGRLNKTIRYRPEAQHTADRRIFRILERADWDDESFLFAGINSYQPEDGTRGVLQEGTALDMIQDVAAAEGGMAYMSQQGNSLNFIDRAHMADAPPIYTIGDDATATIRYSAVQRNMGLDLLYNTIIVNGLEENQIPESAHDDASAGLYGERPYEVTWPLVGQATHHSVARAFRANELLGNYKNPALRFETVKIPTARYPASDRRAFITGQEVGHVVTVKRTPPGGGFFGTIGGVLSLDCVIIGIDHHLTPRWCETTFTLTNQF